ncbi:MAG: S66 family peptidase [Thermoplasmataceae archaeon]
MLITKPGRLKRGDKIAIVSPSRTLPSIFPTLAEQGIENLREYFGLEPVIFPHAFSPIEIIYKNPKLRADDLNQAFSENHIKGIISTIGGNESVRIIDYLDSGIIQSNPKIFTGFSDTTTITSYLFSRNIASIYGGAVMAGFAQMSNFPAEFVDYWETILQKDSSGLEMERFVEYSEGYPNWMTTEDFSAINKSVESYPWEWLNGEIMKGKVFAANFEILDVLRGTRFFPPLVNFDDALLLLETSEIVPSPELVEMWFRNLGISGVLERVNGIAFGRFRGYTKEMREEVHSAIQRVMDIEFGLDKTPIVSGVDFGHTDPYFPIPVGIDVQIRGEKATLLESLTK